MGHRGRVRAAVRRKLFLANDTLGLRVERRITVEAAEQMVQEHKARRVESADGSLLGYQRCRETNAAPVVVGSPASAAVPTRGETELAACGVSRTEGMTGWQRERRRAEGRAQYDAVELARVKVRAFAPRCRA